MFDASHAASHTLTGREPQAGARLDVTFVQPVQPTATAADSAAKRALDVAGALLLLIALLPLLLLIAMVVVAESRGPALFRQTRTGLDGKPFQIYKFRSMRVQEDGDRVVQATKGDSRVTRVGGFLRRSSLDELPQLINVLKGDMSLVGPRPHALAHDRYYGDLVPDYARRFRTRPGITGLSQVSGLRGETRTVEEMARRIETDNAYIDGWSFKSDVTILARTAVLIWRDEQAY